jgi:peptide/nickel transport system substrate-binding protein
MRQGLIRQLAVTTVAAVIALGAAATSLAAASTYSPAKSGGGTLNVVITGSQWPGLDSATDTQDAADSTYLNAIYGQLFEINEANQITPDQATAWKLTDHNSTLVFTIRKGLVFSNGDAMTAADVAWSINRDETPSFGNIGLSNLPLTSAGCTSAGSVVTCPLKNPDVAVVPAFIGEAWDWTVDETALNSMGESAYAQDPIGAGPFKIASNEASAQLDVVKNSKYWEAGHPLLNGIDFTSVGTDQSAADSLESGQGNMALFVSTLPLLKSLPAQGLVVTKEPALTTEFVLFNTLSGPFSNIIAREAASYATDPKALVSALYSNEFKTVESQTASGQEFYAATNKYYHPYNLTKAKALVKELGGLTVDLCTTTNNTFFINEVQAIATMWEAAGITVNIQDYSLQQMLGITFSGAWQAIDENWGFAVDPGDSDNEFFAELANGTVFSGNNNASLQGLLNKGLALANPAARAKIYTQIGNIENQQDLAEFMYAKNNFIVATKNVHDSGDLPNGEVLWENVSLS